MWERKKKLTELSERKKILIGRFKCSLCGVNSSLISVGLGELSCGFLTYIYFFFSYIGMRKVCLKESIGKLFLSLFFLMEEKYKLLFTYNRKLNKRKHLYFFFLSKSTNFL